MSNVLRSLLVILALLSGIVAPGVACAAMAPAPMAMADCDSAAPAGLPEPAACDTACMACLILPAPSAVASKTDWSPTPSFLRLAIDFAGIAPAPDLPPPRSGHA